MFPANTPIGMAIFVLAMLGVCVALAIGLTWVFLAAFLDWWHWNH